MQVISQQKSLAGVFHLDALIKSKDKNIKKVGEGMGFLMIIKLSSLELSDIVSDTDSMMHVNHALLRYVITMITKL